MARLALVGLALLMPALLMELVASSGAWAPGNGVHRSFEQLLSTPGTHHVLNVLSPILFLGGALAALLLNLATIARISVRQEAGELVSTIRLRRSAPNIAIVVASLGVMAVLVLYALLENWTCFTGQQFTC